MINRAVRRLAFQALFQIDAQGGYDRASLVEWLEHAETPGHIDERMRERALELARQAYSARDAADAEMASLAPGWPAHRQAPVDRAILRLAHAEMTSAPDPARLKAIINDAVELAKEFSTENSPRFVNALLDKVFRRLVAAAPGTPANPAVHDR
jgi:N utilization substance protein B